MRAKLIFDLDDPYDRVAHLRAVKSLDMALVLWDLTHNNKEDFSGDFEKGVAFVYDKLYKLLENYDINLEELIS